MSKASKTSPKVSPKSTAPSSAAASPSGSPKGSPSGTPSGSPTGTPTTSTSTSGTPPKKQAQLSKIVDDSKSPKQMQLNSSDARMTPSFCSKDESLNVVKPSPETFKNIIKSAKETEDEIYHFLKPKKKYGIMFKQLFVSNLILTIFNVILFAVWIGLIYYFLVGYDDYEDE